MSRQKRVLILDTADQAGSTLRPLVEQYGMSVECVPDRDTAIVFLPYFWPDLIVVDASIHTSDGLEFCEHVRTDPDLDAVQLVVLHSGASPQTVDHGMALGADAYLADQMTCEDVASLLSELLYDPLDDDGQLI